MIRYKIAAILVLGLTIVSKSAYATDAQPTRRDVMRDVPAMSAEQTQQRAEAVQAVVNDESLAHEGAIIKVSTHHGFGNSNYQSADGNFALTVDGNVVKATHRDAPTAFYFDANMGSVTELGLPISGYPGSSGFSAKYNLAKNPGRWISSMENIIAFAQEVLKDQTDPGAVSQITSVVKGLENQVGLKSQFAVRISGSSIVFKGYGSGVIRIEDTKHYAIYTLNPLSQVVTVEKLGVVSVYARSDSERFYRKALKRMIRLSQHALEEANDKNERAISRIIRTLAGLRR